VRDVLAPALQCTPQPRREEHQHHRGSTHRACGASQEGEAAMLETIAVILIVLWLLGMVSGYTIGSFIHLLLVLAVVLFIVRLLSGRRVV
jgi:hypothetical protein